MCVCVCAQKDTGVCVYVCMCVSGYVYALKRTQVHVAHTSRCCMVLPAAALHGLTRCRPAWSCPLLPCIVQYAEARGAAPPRVCTCRASIQTPSHTVSHTYTHIHTLAHTHTHCHTQPSSHTTTHSYAQTRTRAHFHTLTCTAGSRPARPAPGTACTRTGA